MRSGLRVIVLAASALALVFSTRAARGERPESPTSGVFVLPLMTDDADDQADALTRTLRARVRNMPAWSLTETTQSFETLSIALRCPPKPDEGCLARIADQLHADHYIWGTMSRAHAEVIVELRLWSRDGPEAQVSATYPDNLKDPESPRLRAVAVRLLETLTHASAEGSVVVHAGTGGGAVLIDGVERATLSAGTAKIVTGQGAHIVAVRVPGLVAAQRTVDVGPAPRDVTFALSPAPAESETESAQVDTRKLVGYSGIAAGAVLVVAGAIEMGRWVDDKRTSDQQRALVPASITDVCKAQGNAAAAAACQTTKSETTAAVLAWVFTLAGVAVAGTGTWLLWTSGRQGDRPQNVARPPVEIVPTIGPQAGSLAVRMTF
jgi:hypothetical protein